MKHDPVKRALLISLVVSGVSLLLKIVAFFITGSSAALSDSMESVVHFFAVAFVVYGYYLSLKPADDNHHYGHERIELLSVGAEGTIIIVAAITIVYYAVQSMVVGITIENIGTGMLMLVVAALVNLALGTYVLRVGKKHNNMMAISNGKHTLTDVWTSGGVVTALLAIHFTGWLYIDIIVSLMVAAYISWEAWKLLKFSVKGIMDTCDPDTDKAIRTELEKNLPEHITGWHHLRHRTSGKTTWIELHLIFSDDISLEQAHAEATVLERRLMDSLQTDSVITMHLEPHEAHDRDHKMLRGANKKKDLDEFA